MQFYQLNDAFLVRHKGCYSYCHQLVQSDEPKVVTVQPVPFLSVLQTLVVSLAKQVAGYLDTSFQVLDDCPLAIVVQFQFVRQGRLGFSLI